MSKFIPNKCLLAGVIQGLEMWEKLICEANTFEQEHLWCIPVGGFKWPLSENWENGPYLGYSVSGGLTATRKCNFLHYLSSLINDKVTTSE